MHKLFSSFSHSDLEDMLRCAVPNCALLVNERIWQDIIAGDGFKWGAIKNNTSTMIDPFNLSEIEVHKLNIDAVYLVPRDQVSTLKRKLRESQSAFHAEIVGLRGLVVTGKYNE